MSDGRVRHEGGARGRPVRLRTDLIDPVSEQSVPRMWRRIAERRASPVPRQGAIFAWAALGAGVAVVVMALVLVAERGFAPAHPPREAPAGALVRKDGSPVGVVATGGARVDVDLSDGSRITAEDGAQLEALASSSREFIVRLSAGTAVFNVEPFGPRRWVVEAGLASVEVVGTRFVVSRRPTSVRVEVDRGSVLVRGVSVPDGIVRLDAGSAIDVNAPPPAPAPSTSAALSGIPPSTATRRAPHEESGEAWRHAAAAGDYAHAYGNLGADGLQRETALAESGEELFALADVARLSGHPSEAVPPLERLEREFASSPRAPLAAVTLGRIEIDLGNAVRASKAFERALALRVPAALEEDVYARLVEAYVKAGNETAARSARDVYGKKFPSGRRRADIERWLSR